MIINVKHPFPGLSGFKTIPLSVDKRWLKKRMKETGWTAQQCAEIEFLTSAKDAIAKTCELTARINREYSKAFANDAGAGSETPGHQPGCYYGPGVPCICGLIFNAGSKHD